MNTSITKNVTHHHSPRSLAILSAVKDYMSILKGKFMFGVTITIPSIDQYQARYDTINTNSLVRALSNSKFSIGSVDNRTLWQSQIMGACYKIYVRQQSPESNIGVTYQLLCLTPKPHIDYDFQTGFRQRVSKMFPEATVMFDVVEVLNSTCDFEKQFMKTFKDQSLVYLDSKAYGAHGEPYTVLAYSDA